MRAGSRPSPSPRRDRFAAQSTPGRPLPPHPPPPAQLVFICSKSLPHFPAAIIEYFVPDLTFTEPAAPGIQAPFIFCQQTFGFTSLGANGFRCLKKVIAVNEGKGGKKEKKKRRRKKEKEGKEEGKADGAAGGSQPAPGALNPQRRPAGRPLLQPRARLARPRPRRHPARERPGGAPRPGPRLPPLAAGRRPAGHRAAGEFSRSAREERGGLAVSAGREGTPPPPPNFPPAGRPLTMLRAGGTGDARGVAQAPSPARSAREGEVSPSPRPASPRLHPRPDPRPGPGPSSVRPLPPPRGASGRGGVGWRPPGGRSGLRPRTE